MGSVPPVLRENPTFFRSQRGNRRGHSRRLWTLIGVASCLALPMTAGAGETLSAQMIIDQPDQRYVELRQVLLSVTDVADVEHDRRRLSADERDALSRELREAMTGVYDNRLPRNDP